MRLPRRRRRRSQRAVGRLAPGRARRRRASCSTRAGRRRRVRQRRRDRAQLLPLGGDHRAGRGCRSRCSRPTPRPTASARSATWRRCPQRQVDDLVAIREQHERVGLRVRARGRRRARAASTWPGRWPDWEAPVEALLHERRGGWADAMQTVRHLADAGARRRRRDPRGRRGRRVRARRRRRRRDRDERGSARVRDAWCVAPGPWVARVWSMLGLAPTSRWRASPPARRVLEGAGGRVRAQRRGPAAARRAPRRPSSTSTRPGRCAPTATAACSSTAPGASTSAWAAPARGITGGGLPVLLVRSRARPVRPRQPRARRRAGVRGVLRLRPGDRAAALPRPLRRLAGDRRGRHRPPHPRQLPGLRLGRCRTSTRSSTRATASRRWPSAGSRPTTCSTTASRCSSRSGSGASRAAQRTRRRWARTRGPEAAAARAPRARAPRPRGARLGPARPADHDHLRVRREAQPALRRAVAAASAAASAGTRVRSPPSSTRRSAGCSGAFALVPIALGLVVAALAIFFTLTGNIFNVFVLLPLAMMIWFVFLRPTHQRRYRAGHLRPAALGAAPAVGAGCRAVAACRRRRGTAPDRRAGRELGMHLELLGRLRDLLPQPQGDLVLHHVAVDVEQERREQDQQAGAGLVPAVAISRDPEEAARVDEAAGDQQNGVDRQEHRADRHPDVGQAERARPVRPVPAQQQEAD